MEILKEEEANELKVKIDLILQFLGHTLTKEAFPELSSEYCNRDEYKGYRDSDLAIIRYLHKRYYVGYKGKRAFVWDEKNRVYDDSLWGQDLCSKFDSLVEEALRVSKASQKYVNATTEIKNKAEKILAEFGVTQLIEGISITGYEDPFMKIYKSNDYFINLLMISFVNEENSYDTVYAWNYFEEKVEALNLESNDWIDYLEILEIATMVKMPSGKE